MGVGLMSGPIAQGGVQKAKNGGLKPLDTPVNVDLAYVPESSLNQQIEDSKKHQGLKDYC